MSEESVIQLNEPIKKLQPSWKKAPEVADLQKEYESANNALSAHMTNVSKWIDNFHVKNDAAAKPRKDRSSVTPKLIRKHAEWQYPALSEPFLSGDKLFKVEPVTWEDKGRAVQNELVLNNQFQFKINKVKFIDSYIRSSVDLGTAIVKLSWINETKSVTEDTVEYGYEPVVQTEELTAQYNQLAQLQAESPDSYNQVEEILRKGFEETQATQIYVVAYPKTVTTAKVTKTIQNRPELEICTIQHILVDPTCKGNLDKANFIIHQFESSVAELKKDGRYSNLEYLHAQNSEPLQQTDSRGETSASYFQFSDKARKKIIINEYWGYYDIHGDNVLHPIVAAWSGTTLIRLDLNPYPDGFLPFVIVPLLPITDSVYGEPAGALLEDNQKILGALTRGVIDIVGQTASGQRGFSKSFLDATNKQKFTNGQDYEYNPNTDPRTHLYTHTFPEIPQSALVLMQMQQAEAETLTGVKAFSGGSGITGENLGNTAAGVRSAMDAASKREMAILRRLADGIATIGKRILAMNAEFLDEEEVVRITNKTFVKVRRDDLQGCYDLTLNISTPEADNVKAQELAFMLQTMGNNIDAGMSKLILSEIARLRKMPDLAKQIQDYAPQPDPLAQKKAELEVQLLEAQIAQLMANAQESGAKAEVQGAKVGVEHARAQQMQNAADGTAQKFFNEQTGVSHQRDLEKIAAQQGGSLAVAKTKGDIDLAKTRLQHNSAILQKHADNELAPEINN